LQYLFNICKKLLTKKFTMNTKFTQTLFLAVLFLSLSQNSFSQKAFLGGGGNASMPVVNYDNYDYSNSIFGGHSGQVTYAVASSDGNFLYFETYDQWANKKWIHKIDANSQEYLGQLPLLNRAYDLEISDDNEHLFFHYYSMLYKLNTTTMLMEDSISLPSFSFIEVYDNNTVFCSSLSKIQVVDFITGEITEVPTGSGGHNDMAFNSDKSKLYTLKSSPHKIIMLDVTALTIETDLNIEGTTGLPWDIALGENDQYIYALFSGVNGTNGTMRVLNSNDLTTVTDIPTPEGYGKLAISPDNKLWIPAGTTSQIAIVDMASNTLETTLNTNDYNFFYGPYTVAFSNLGTTGLSQVSVKNSLEIYPNPSSGSFNVRSQNSIEKVDIFSMNGTLMESYQPNSKNHKINFIGTEGSYIIQITDSKGGIQIETIIIQK